MAFVAVCGGLAALQLTAWLAHGLGGPWLIAAIVALSCTATIGSGWAAWRSQGPASLAFDGRRWQWGERPGRLTVAIDLQGWMMLRFQPEAGMSGRRCWIAASRRGVGGAWPLLRAALYSCRDAVDPPPPVAPAG